MKKIVAIMAVSLMLFTSCGQTKDIITPGLNEDEENTWNVNYIVENPTVVKKPLSQEQKGLIVGVAVALPVLVVELMLVKCGCW
jgi:hypothetical protein